ncbi:MAG TPA: tryptophan 7-halogenase, partial [Ktedonosporobacter sp.]|nr:tryptophan 7-halogenase [Ktedonosporobacter sp.]
MGNMFDRIAALPAEKRALLMQQLQERRPTGEASSDSDQYDVAILGGGMAGLTVALQIKKSRPATRILVVEKQKHPVPEAAHKVGESTVEIASHYLRDILELDNHLQTQQLRKFGLRMFFSSNGNQDITQRVELGSTVFPPLCTYQLDRGRLENALGSELPRQGIVFLDDCKVQQIVLQPQSESHRINILQEGNEREVAARWVVDASGRNTLLQRQLGLAKKVGHTANAVWFRINYIIDVNDWSTDLAWKARITDGERWLSTNHLMGPGYWVWIIP